MKKKYHLQICIVILTLFFGVTKSVYAQQSVSFNSPVNTKTRPIELQLKKTYELEKDHSYYLITYCKLSYTDLTCPGSNE